MPTALLVEDDPTALRALTELVERRGFSTERATDLDEARASLARGRFDAVLLDVHLPGGSGIDLLLELPKDRRPQVLLMSGDESVRAAFASLPLDELHFLKKPVVAAELGKILQRVRRRCSDDERKAAATTERIVGASPEIARLRKLIDKVAPTELAVYVEGESGTGKELIAQAIHGKSPRRDGPFVAINCGAIPENLIDSELFGHEKGAFTGADTARGGVFEQANGGTLFLDEVAEMPVELQVRLLRALETRKVRRVGGDREVAVDVRIVSATNRSFEKAIEAGQLREDLFHRLCVFPIVSPPLRARGDDVLLLAEAFLKEFHDGPLALSERVAAILRGYAWPGNVRQLRNAMQHAAVLAEGETVTTAALPEHLLADAGAQVEELDDARAVAPQAPVEAAPQAPAAPAAAGGADHERLDIPIGTSIADAERRLIEATLDKLDGDKKSTADVLGVSLRTLYNRLSSYEEADGSEQA